MNVPPTTDEIRRMSAVAANYNALQGLTTVPVSLWMLAFGATILFAPAAADWVVMSLAVMVVASALIARSYRNRFGRVRQGGYAAQAAVVVAALLSFIVSAIVLNLLGWKAGELLGVKGSPIWSFGIQFALILVIAFYLAPKLRGRTADMSISRHWQVMCVLLVLISLVPVGLLTGGVIHPLNATNEINMAASLWTMGACFLIGGLIDHRLLMRSLGAASAEEQ